jgi:hypothetical protein
MHARSNAWVRAAYESITAGLAGLVLFYGLVVATHAAFRPRAGACLNDSECHAGAFCDRDACVPRAASYFTPASFGKACTNDSECGGYLCVDDRCRSCAGDDECAEQPSGQTVCTTLALTEGSRCAGRKPASSAQANARF